MALPLPPKPPPSSIELIALYLEAQEKLIEEIISLSNRGAINTAQYKKLILDRTQTILGSLLASSNEWASIAIPAAYLLGIRESNQALLEAFAMAGVVPPELSEAFSVIDNESIAVILDETDSLFENIANALQENIKRRVEAAVKQAVKEKITTGSTIKRTQAALLKALAKEGITAFSFRRNGKLVNLPLSSYAETVIRSTTAEVTNQASIRRTQRVGGDLVKMTSHAESCPICWPLQGRVYSISGDDPEYPPLETAFSGDHANIHPNCRHRIKPYIPALKSDQELAQDKAFSNRSFDIGRMSRSQQRIFNRQIKAYNQGQQVKRVLNANGKQFVRYQTRLGEDAPKTLASFVSIKNRNGPAWEKLQESFRTAGVA